MICTIFKLVELNTYIKDSCNDFAYSQYQLYGLENIVFTYVTVFDVSFSHWNKILLFILIFSKLDSLNCMYEYSEKSIRSVKEKKRHEISLESNGKQ